MTTQRTRLQSRSGLPHPRPLRLEAGPVSVEPSFTPTLPASGPLSRSARPGSANDWCLGPCAIRREAASSRLPAWGPLPARQGPARTRAARECLPLGQGPAPPPLLHPAPDHGPESQLGVVCTLASIVPATRLTHASTRPQVIGTASPTHAGKPYLAPRRRSSARHRAARRGRFTPPPVRAGPPSR